MVQMTGSGDTTIAEWDVVRGDSVAIYKSHTGSVKTIDVKQDEPSICSIRSTCMYIHVYHIHTLCACTCTLYMYLHMFLSWPLNYTSYVENVHLKESACALLPVAGMFVSGSRDGSIFVWDTRCSSRGESALYKMHILCVYMYGCTSMYENACILPCEFRSLCTYVHTYIVGTSVWGVRIRKSVDSLWCRHIHTNENRFRSYMYM